MSIVYLNVIKIGKTSSTYIFNIIMNNNKIEQPIQCGATLTASVSLTSKLVFYSYFRHKRENIFKNLGLGFSRLKIFCCFGYQFNPPDAFSISLNFIRISYFLYFFPDFFNKMNRGYHKLQFETKFVKIEHISWQKTEFF